MSDDLNIEKRLARLERAVKESYPDYGWTEDHDEARELLDDLVEQISVGASPAFRRLACLGPMQRTLFWAQFDKKFPSAAAFFLSLIQKADQDTVEG